MEAEFASWQAKVGPDFSALESALRPVERYVREDLLFSVQLFPHLVLLFSHIFEFSCSHLTVVENDLAIVFFLKFQIAVSIFFSTVIYVYFFAPYIKSDLLLSYVQI